MKGNVLSFLCETDSCTSRMQHCAKDSKVVKNPTSNDMIMQVWDKAAGQLNLKENT